MPRFGKNLPGLAMQSDTRRASRFADLLSEPLRNGVYKSKEFHGRGAKIVNMGELFGHPRLGAVDMKRVELSSSELSRSQLRAGDLLFARRSLVAEGAGKCCLVTAVKEPTTFESSIIRARPDAAVASSAYLFYFFASQQGRDLMRTILRQVAVSGITGGDLAELKIPLPAIEDQNAVARVLSLLDDRIELLHQTNSTLENMVRAIFKSWFVDFDPVREHIVEIDPVVSAFPRFAPMFPSEFEDSALGQIPAGWRVATFGELCLNPRSQAQPDQLPPDTPYIGLEHMPRGSLSLFEMSTSVDLESNKSWFDRDDILFGKLRPYFHKVGLAPCKGVCSTDILVLRPQVPNAHAFVTMHASSKAVIDYATRLSNGAKMPRTNWSDLSAFQLVLPPVELLRAFNEMTRPLFQRMRQNLAQSQTVANFRDTLLPRIISGALHIRRAEKLAEEAMA